MVRRALAEDAGDVDDAEDAEDAQAAIAARAEMIETSTPAIPWEEVKADLGLT